VKEKILMLIPCPLIVYLFSIYIADNPTCLWAYAILVGVLVGILGVIVA